MRISEAKSGLIHVLLAYDHDQRKLVHQEEFANSKDATSAYLAMEKKYRNRKRLEIVLIGSDSIETIKVTHSNYFGYGVLTHPLFEDFLQKRELSHS